MFSPICMYACMSKPLCMCMYVLYTVYCMCKYSILALLASYICHINGSAYCENY